VQLTLVREEYNIGWVNISFHRQVCYPWLPCSAFFLGLTVAQRTALPLVCGGVRMLNDMRRLGATR
jgi:hypothetical protein